MTSPNARKSNRQSRGLSISFDPPEAHWVDALVALLRKGGCPNAKRSEVVRMALFDLQHALAERTRADIVKYFVERDAARRVAAVNGATSTLPPYVNTGFNRTSARRRHRRRAGMKSTRVKHHIDASRAAVYRALLDPSAVAKWKVPDGMTCHVHTFDAREGGSLRISLTYDLPTGIGKTTAQTDTYRGRFVKLVPNEQVVEIDEFETGDPALQGEMTITITLEDVDGGTDLVAVHDGLSRGVSPRDNETGWRMALAKYSIS